MCSSSKCRPCPRGRFSWSSRLQYRCGSSCARPPRRCLPPWLSRPPARLPSPRPLVPSRRWRRGAPWKRFRALRLSPWLGSSGPAPSGAGNRSAWLRHATSCPKGRRPPARTRRSRRPFRERRRPRVPPCRTLVEPPTLPSRRVWFRPSVSPLQNTLRAQKGRHLAGEDTAVAVGKGDLGVCYLALGALAAKLPYGLDQQEQPVHSRVVVGEAAAVGIDSELPTGRYPAALNKRTCLALLAEPEVFEEQDRVDGECVVEHSHVHVLGSYARHLVDVAVPVGLPHPEQIDGGLSQIFCALGRSHQQCSATIGYQAAIQNA